MEYSGSRVIRAVLAFFVSKTRGTQHYLRRLSQVLLGLVLAWSWIFFCPEMLVLNCLVLAPLITSGLRGASCSNGIDPGTIHSAYEGTVIRVFLVQGSRCDGRLQLHTPPSKMRRGFPLSGACSGGDSVAEPV